MKKETSYLLPKLRLLARFTDSLKHLIKSGAFYRLSVNKRDMLVRRIRRLQSQLSGATPSLKLSSLLAASALVVSLTSGRVNAQTFAAPQTNPFGLTGIPGIIASPTFVDIDGDLDLDLFAGGGMSGETTFFENTGTPNAPSFGAAQISPFGLDTVVGTIAVPTFADLDGDGDYDAMIGEYYGGFKFFENTGSPTAPAFNSPQFNPFGLTSVPGYIANPALVDLDGDGDLDMLAGGDQYGNFSYFENTGTPTAPAFGPIQTNPFSLIGQYNLVFPALVDLDGDSDLDLFAGGYYGDLHFYQNTGTPTAANFAAPQTNSFNLQQTSTWSVPAAADLDGDGDSDLLVGEYYGGMIYFENVTTLDDVGVAQLTSPRSSCDLSASETITISVQNTGLNTQNSIPVGFSINGGAPVMETITQNINPGASLTYSFIATADLSTMGTIYNFEVWTALPGDGNPGNDLLAIDVAHKATISTFPYTENFEGPNHGFTKGGNNNSSWELGSPSGTTINSAGSGNNSWVTNLSGNYNNMEQGFVESPCFDFTGYATATLSLKVWYSTEAGFDGGAVQYTTNNGLSWSNLGSLLSGTNWYNDQDIDGLFNWLGNGDGWQDDNNGWQTAEHDLAPLIGEPEVSFRVLFGSEGSGNSQDGLGFDDFTILATTPNTAPTSANDTVTVMEDSVYNFATADFQYNDIDGDPIDRITITDLVDEGFLVWNGNPVTLNQVIHAADIDKLNFLPQPGEFGENYDRFGFTVGDGDLNSAEYTMTINVTENPNIGISPVVGQGQLTVFPNPANETIQVQLGDNQNLGEVAITLTNLVGQVVFNDLKNVKSNSDTHRITLDQWPKGVYFLKVSFNNKVLVRKIVVH